MEAYKLNIKLADGTLVEPPLVATCDKNGNDITEYYAAANYATSADIQKLFLPTFNIGTTKHKFENGMTWAQWVASEYNLGLGESGYYVTSDGYIQCNLASGTTAQYVWIGGAKVTSADVITSKTYRESSFSGAA